jgi:hypothetical protein
MNAPAKKRRTTVPVASLSRSQLEDLCDLYGWFGDRVIEAYAGGMATDLMNKTRLTSVQRSIIQYHNERFTGVFEELVREETEILTRKETFPPLRVVK